MLQQCRVVAAGRVRALEVRCAASHAREQSLTEQLQAAERRAEQLQQACDHLIGLYKQQHAPSTTAARELAQHNRNILQEQKLVDAEQRPAAQTYRRDEHDTAKQECNAQGMKEMQKQLTALRGQVGSTANL